MTSERAVEPGEALRALWAWAVKTGPFISGVLVLAEDKTPGLELLAEVPALREKVIAALAAAAPPPEPPIDVERLARAMDAVLPDYFIDAKPGNQVRAKAIAREYVLRGSE